MTETRSQSDDANPKQIANPVYVTRPFMPPLHEFQPYLERIWATQWLTNAGPFHEELENSLASFLGVKHISLFANATLALIVALQELQIAGEVITTPFSFVATAHSLLWNGLEPVFADVDPSTGNLDPAKAEAAITARTSALLPVHVYGQPCDVEQIQRIADRHGLKVLYDAAHAFAVELDGRSVLSHGDLSVLSFHATKVFNTFEGGAIVSPNLDTKKRIDQLRNFGIADEVSVRALGINGKMNELQAAFGLLQLAHIREAMERRRQIDEHYRSQLRSVRGVRCIEKPKRSTCNWSYFPILVTKDHPLGRDGLYAKLKAHGVHARRYFFPLISSFSMYSRLPSAAPGNLPVAEELSRRILCLPIYPDLCRADQDLTIELIQGD